MKKVVAYYRVSTKKQKGLGLDAQKAIVEFYASREGAELVKEFTEVLSGKEVVTRPKLLDAIRFCKESGAFLIVAKVDRLARNVEETFRVKRELEDRLICCDLPSTDSLTLSVFAGLAQRERELISIRTKAALAEKKKKGQPLGKLENLTEEGRKKGTAQMKRNGVENSNNRQAAQVIVALRKQGMSLQEIANKLNSNGFKTVRGRAFRPCTVKIIFERFVHL